MNMWKKLLLKCSTVCCHIFFLFGSSSLLWSSISFSLCMEAMWTVAWPKWNWNWHLYFIHNKRSRSQCLCDWLRSRFLNNLNIICRFTSDSINEVKELNHNSVVLSFSCLLEFASKRHLGVIINNRCVTNPSSVALIGTCTEFPLLLTVFFLCTLVLFLSTTSEVSLAGRLFLSHSYKLFVKNDTNISDCHKYYV